MFQALPDTDGLGEEISASDFANRWRSDPGLLLFHVMSAHHGALAEVSGEWSASFPDGNWASQGVPKALLHPQFATTKQQERIMSDWVGPAKCRKGVGKGKGKPGKGKGQPLAAEPSLEHQ